MNFQAVLLQPHKKSSTKRLREVLNSVFRHLDQVAAASILDVGRESRKRQLSAQTSISPHGRHFAKMDITLLLRPTFHKCARLTGRRPCVCVCVSELESHLETGRRGGTAECCLHLDRAPTCRLLQASVEIPGLQLSTQDYFPYVYFHIDLSLLD